MELFTTVSNTDNQKSAAAYRTISEVAKELGVAAHVLRFWEGKFTQVKPLKRAAGRRYYRPDDIQTLHLIKNLLYTEGYTIRGVQTYLKKRTKKDLQEESATRQAQNPWQPIMQELESIRALLA